MKLLKRGLLSLVIACARAAGSAHGIECKDLRLTPVLDAAQRLEFPASGFSVLPPQGLHWCIQHSERDGVAFIKSPLLADPNPRTSRAAARHTVVAMAREVSVDEAGLNTVEELRVFVERWLRGGGNTRMLGSMLVLDDTPLARFRLIDSRLDLANPFAANCVGFDSLTEERDNLQFRGAVLIMVNRNNFLCRHPHARERILVLIGYSERYSLEAPPSPLLLDAWKQELAPFVQSLKFFVVR